MKALRENGSQTRYLMAKDEVHGFQKKKNADFPFRRTVEFVKASPLK